MEKEKDKVIRENISVFCRLRPVLESDASQALEPSSQPSGVIKSYSSDGKCIYHSSVAKREHPFQFSGFIGPDSSQIDVYDTCAKTIVDSAINGYSGTIFAYGPTNSGKTYTMRGSSDGGARGIVPRAMEHILNNFKSSKAQIWVSYLQIYCEVISDLLLSTDAGTLETPSSSTSAAAALTIREKPSTTQGDATGVYVEGLNRVRVTSVEQLDQLLARGDVNRNTAETLMNSASSRSHSALLVTIMVPEDGKETWRESTLAMVDLAGSERASATVGLAYMRAEEAKAINLSLSALGNCMNALAEGRTHVPYRDSKLTRLLQGSLGGNCRTAVIVTLPSTVDDVGEVISSLRFASRATKIKVEANITRCLNYEALYAESKRQLEVIASAQQEALQQDQRKRLLIDQYERENEAWKMQVDTLKSRVKELESELAMKNSGKATDGGAGAGVGVTAPNDSNEGQLHALTHKSLQQQKEALEQQHMQEMEAMRKRYESRIANLQRVNSEQALEITTLQTELQSERERHLTTVREIKKLHDKSNSVESVNAERIQELLNELSDKTSIIEDLQDALSASAGLLTTVNESSDVAIREREQLESKIEELSAAMASMFTKEQVMQVEGKFMESISKLTARVLQLERGGGGGGGGGGGSQGYNPSALLNIKFDSNNNNNNSDSNSVGASNGMNAGNGVRGGAVMGGGMGGVSLVIGNSTGKARRLEPGGKVRPAPGR